jgi:N-sulfoglucosamine sulfohydrolase
MQRLAWLFLILVGFVTGFLVFDTGSAKIGKRPNFLLVITDDQSWIHTGFGGDPVLRTPNMDRIAQEGVHFKNGYVSAPTCTASRTALLSGQHFWQTGAGAQLWGEYTARTPNYQKILQQHGYHVGYTGKGWGPGKSLMGNPAGKDYNQAKRDVDPAFSTIDHVENLRRFLTERKQGQPFSFWISPTEPHRPFKAGIGFNSGRFRLEEVVVPPFLPDDPAVRADLADYLFEIEWFDEELGRALAVLQEAGELENTVIVFTSDNGMAFPRAKSNNYEYGTHVPLAIRWGSRLAGPRTVTDYVSLVDLAPTFLELAHIPVPKEMSGRSLKPQLLSDKSGRVDLDRNAAFTGFQRHIGNARLENRGYPSRAIHSDGYLYIRNVEPERWPAGRPPFLPDIDDGSPSKNLIIQEAAYASFRELAGGKRPAAELYRVSDDPAQLNNLAGDAEYRSIEALLAQRLEAELKRTADPVVTGNGAVFDSYPYTAPGKKE